MARRARKHETAFWIMIGALASSAFSAYSAVGGDWNTATWSGCVAVAVPAWLFAIKAPTTCGVATRAGRPCPNPTWGVLFGCGSADHTWTKFFARFGWHRSHAPIFIRDNTRSPAPIPPPSEDDAVVVRIAEDAKSRVVFWLAILATFAGCLSAATDIAGLING